MVEKKNKTGHLFFMRNPYMKFQNISIHGSKLMLCTLKQQMAKTCKGQLQQNFIKFVENNQVISSSVPFNMSNIKTIAQILFEISC